jgi:hypothetical protein
MNSRNTPPMMACGHAANSRRDEEPCCVICAGIVPGWDVVADAPDLSGRVARCCYCGRERPSSPTLAFFAHRPNGQHDDFYDGCRGWD